MRSDPLTRELERARLDQQLAPLRAALKKSAFRRPKRGWVRAIRDTLGMNGRQLAERMGIARPHLSQLESAELRGAVSLQTLQRAAAALDCDFVYAFVPRNGKSLDAQVHERAREVAKTLISRVGASMALEAQGVENDRVLKKEVERVAAELMRGTKRGLWDS